ncbi:MAG: YgdI/YgdR family lipoprotein [Desulfobacterales bacterium]
MKRLIMASSILFALLFTMACATATTYQIVLKNGQTLEASSEPVLDKETGYYDYLDKDDKKVKLKEEDVVIIKEK